MNKLFTAILMLFCGMSFCQPGGISISPGQTPPDPSAGLDVNFNNKGFLMPRISKAQRNAISNPALGLQIFDTTTNCFEAYGFGNWQTLSCLCTGAPSSPSVITGNNNPCANASNITYSVGLILGATSYTWAVPADATIIAGQGTNSITVNFGVDTGSISVTANNSCGSSSPSVLPVTINTIPSTPGSISGSDSVCSNTSGNVYSISPAAGATTYTWTVPGDAIITSGQSTTSATVTFGTTSGNVAVTSGNVCGNSAESILIVTNTLVTHGSETFYYDGNPQMFTVPGCITSVTIAAYGAQGSGGDGSNGGGGGLAEGSLSINSGEILYVYAGGQNGYNGGGVGGQSDNYGGGESDVRVGGIGTANWVIVAGGGGGGSPNGGLGGAGGGGTSCANGAAGAGGTSGSAGNGSGGTCGDGGGAGAPNGGWSGGGGGAGLTSGGAGTANNYSNTAGSGTQGVGGSYGSNNSCGCCSGEGCGGGGGYYGGGGSSDGQCAAGCGGGGSSWAAASMTNLSFSGGVQSGNGQVIITW